MGGDECENSEDEDDDPADRDEQGRSVERLIDELHAAFMAAIAAGDDAGARALVDDFEKSLDWLSDDARHEVISETTVWLGEEARMLRDGGSED